MIAPLHRLRRLAALRLLGAVLACLASLAPRHGLAQVSGGDGLTMVICGAGGSYTLTLPADSSPAPPPPPLCCLAACPVALAEALPLLPVVAVAVVAVLKVPRHAPPPEARRDAGYQPRAPPVL